MFLKIIKKGVPHGMSVIATAINNKIEDWLSFFRIIQSYLKRKNPLMNMVANLVNSFQSIANNRQHLKAVKYRVQLMNYRIYQMDQVIHENNPHNFMKGKNINQLR